MRQIAAIKRQHSDVEIFINLYIVENEQMTNILIELGSYRPVAKRVLATQFDAFYCTCSMLIACYFNVQFTLCIASDNTVISS